LLLDRIVLAFLETSIDPGERPVTPLFELGRDMGQ
jgi:hypothetical protein